MSINIREKGKQGEYDVCKMLQPLFPTKLERNLEQTRAGGADIKGCEPFQIEVKRVQDCGLGNKQSWWKQVNRASKPDEIPVVIYRPNKAKWRVLIGADLLGVDSDEWMDVSIDLFHTLVVTVLHTDLTDLSSLPICAKINSEIPDISIQSEVDAIR